MTNDQHRSHRRHRNVLYSLVIVLTIIQLVSFSLMSVQISKLDSKFSNNIRVLDRDLKDFTTGLVTKYNKLYQENFKEISDVVTEQKKDFKQEINLIKSTQEDFSGIIEESVRSVVTVSAGNSIGSGFIVNSTGYIVTNNHVIDGNEGNIHIITYDRERIPTDLIGVDKVRDLALLKIPEKDYRSFELASQEEIQVGKRVIAIGNPLGLSFSVTEGIISALNRVGPSGFNEYIQTDVSLNPGNSGGPLIDLQGKVVGINNFKIGGAESLGFSLQSEVIKQRINFIANKTIIP